jgi:hypothetical protein
MWERSWQNVADGMPVVLPDELHPALLPRLRKYGNGRAHEGKDSVTLGKCSTVEKDSTRGISISASYIPSALPLYVASLTAMAPPISQLISTRYALVIDAGSSGSRLQIYSWQDPEAERQGIVTTIKDRFKKQGKAGKKGKGKADAADELEWEIESALRRLVKVEKGAPGDLWVKKAEPGM